MQGLYNKAIGIPLSPAQVAVPDKFYCAGEQADPHAPSPTTDRAVPGPESISRPEGIPKGTPSLAAAAGHKLSGEYLAILRGMYDDLGPGWLHVTPRKCVPKNACYVGCDRDTYVWITRNGMQQLTNLTILIIDAATRDTSQEIGGPRTTQSRFQLPFLAPPASL